MFGFRLWQNGLVPTPLVTPPLTQASLPSTETEANAVSSDEWRSALVLRSARLLFVGVGVLVPYTLATMPQTPASAVGLFAVLIAAGVASFAPGVSPRARVTMLVLGLLGLGACSVYSYGPTPASLLGLATAVALSGMFLEQWSGALVVALTATAFFVFGAAGRLESVPRAAADHVLLMSWARMAASYTLATSILLLVISTVVRRTERQLAQTRSLLEEVLRERSARAAAEKALREEEARSQQALEAARLGSLVAGVAHEVRTPLFSITALVDAFEGGTREELEDAGRLLHQEVQRLNRLMTDLLEYGRPSVRALEAGSVADPLGRALRTCEALATSKGVTIRAVVSEDLPLVRYNPRLEQALQNLVANAIQHSPTGATVRVTMRTVRESSPSVLECGVEDQGPGISEEDLPRLFEPFFSRRKGGTGLGLSLVQRIADEHGGHVAATNRQEGGALFTITLPTASAP
jgi:signal transduction histidine kinase